MANHDKTLLLIDSHALIHRAYHAIPPTFRTAQGEQVNAVYGFSRLLLEVLEKFKPSHVIALFDAPGDTVRHEDYAAYKANRSSPEEDLIAQIPRIEELLAAFDIPRVRLPGYEADDLIGTIDARHSGKWARTVIVTGDKDLFQLVDEDTFVYMAGSAFSQSKLYDTKAVQERMGLGPDYITDLKALMGDPSDNIPGVAGIGEKGAVKLIQEFGHLEELYEKIEQVENRYKTKLAVNHELAVLSKKIATIITDAPFSFDFEGEAEFGTFDPEKLKGFFREMAFKSLMTKLFELMVHYVPEEVVESESRPSLFDDVAAVQLPEIEKWDGEPITTPEIFLKGEYEKSGDPLSWKLKKLIVRYAENTVTVGGDQVIDFFNSLKSKKVVTDDGKALFHTLLNLGYELEHEIYDFVLAAYMASYGQARQELESVLAYYHREVTNGTAAILGELSQVYPEHLEALADNDQLQKLIGIEMRLVRVIVEMERNGITLDTKLLEGFAEKLANKISELEQGIYLDAGHEFNISSPKQVGEVLFIEKTLPHLRKTKGGSYSTDERTLMELIDTDPIVQKILDYRELTKMLSTYVKPLPQLVNKETGRIHATFNQIGALTGRFSSNNPNMQNIPVGEVDGMSMRSAFVADQGSVLVAMDYSQQELRLLAEASGEENMLAAFTSGEDIHARTAAEIFGVPLDEVTKEQRRYGKTINFGIVYGMSSFGFADRLKVGQAAAAEFINKYFARYPKVKEYFASLIAEAKVTGFVSTLFGRRRTTYDLSVPKLRSRTEREVMNFPLQGSAADIIKMAMVELAPVLTKYPASLILQVHDELIFEYKTDKELGELISDKNFLDFAREVRQTMLDVVQLRVPFEVGVEVGKSWWEMEPLSI